MSLIDPQPQGRESSGPDVAAAVGRWRAAGAGVVVLDDGAWFGLRCAGCGALAAFAVEPWYPLWTVRRMDAFRRRHGRPLRHRPGPGE